MYKQHLYVYKRQKKRSMLFVSEKQLFEQECSEQADGVQLEKYKISHECYHTAVQEETRKK